MNGYKFIACLSLILAIYGCTKTDGPAGHLVAEDPELMDLSFLMPRPMDTIAGLTGVKMHVPDHFRLESLEFSMDVAWPNTSIYTFESELIYSGSPEYVYEMDFAWQSGLRTLTASVTDTAGNKTERQLSVYVIPLIKHMIESSTTNSLHIYDIDSDETKGTYICAGGYTGRGSVRRYEDGHFVSTGFSEVRDFTVDGTGTIWGYYVPAYTTGYRVGRFRGFSNGTIVVDTLIEDIFPQTDNGSGFAHSFASNSRNEIWGIYESSNRSYGCFCFFDGVFDTLQQPGAEQLVVDQSDRVWISFGDRVSYYDGTQWQSTGYAGKSIRRIWVDYSNNVLLQNTDGIFRYTGDGWQLYQEYPDSTYFRNCDIDNSGSLWSAYESVIKSSGGSVIREYTGFWGGYNIDNTEVRIRVDCRNNVWVSDEWGLYMINERGIID
jgi:hypothetical protein